MSTKSPFCLPENIDPDVYLLVGDPNKKTEGFLTRFMSPVGLAVSMGVTSVITNLIRGKPQHAGIHKHLMFMILGGVIGETGYRHKMAINSERDLQFLHYVSLHPEDFQAPKRTLYRDYLTPWVPIR